MEAQRYTEVLRPRPERIISAIAVRPVFRRRAPDKSASQSRLGASLQFRARPLDIVQRDQRTSDQPLWIGPAIVNHPLVVSFEAGLLELDILERKHPHPECGVE